MNIIKKIYFKIYLIVKYGIHPNKPIYQLKLARNLFKAKFFGFLSIFGVKKFAPRGIDFAVTYGCNFRCSYCYARRLIPKNPKPMTIDDYKRVAKEASALGFITFSFQGGEPALLGKKMVDIFKAFNPKRHHITVTTNGSLLTEEMLKSWAGAGLDTVYFSVDSGIPEEHDRTRNQPGNFEKIMEAIEWVKKYKMKIAINTVVSKENLYTEGFKKILDFSHKNRIMLETIYARPLGGWAKHSEYILSEEDIKYYYDLRKNYPFVVRDLDNNYGCWGCPAVKEVLYVTAFGDVCACPYTHVSFGNLHQEPLEKIRSRALKIKWYDHYNWECLTALDEEFMKIYFPLADEKGIVPVEDLISGAKD